MMRVALNSIAGCSAAAQLYVSCQPNLLSSLKCLKSMFLHTGGLHSHNNAAFRGSSIKSNPCDACKRMISASTIPADLQHSSASSSFACPPSGNLSLPLTHLLITGEQQQRRHTQAGQQEQGAALHPWATRWPDGIVNSQQSCGDPP